jgi:hypothetical protein
MAFAKGDPQKVTRLVRGDAPSEGCWVRQKRWSLCY